MYSGGCARYANLADEQEQSDLLLEQLITYLLVSIGSGVVIALLIVICTKH